MAIFGEKKRSAAARLQAGDFRDEAEKRALLDQLRAEAPRPAELAFLLSHTDPAFRQLAVALVRANATPEMVEVLVREAEGKPEAVRRAILGYAALLPPVLVSGAIDRMIDARSPSALQRSGWQLAFELSPATRRAYLDRGLKSINAAVRTLALQKLIEEAAPKAGHRPAAEILTRLLELADDTSYAVREKVLEALVTFDDPRVVGQMVERMAYDATPQLRKVAADHIVRLAAASPAIVRDTLLPLVAEREEAVRRAALEVLLRCGAPREIITTVLEHAASLPGWMRARVIEALSNLGPSVTPLAVQLLQHAVPEVRSQALAVLAELKDPRTAGAVLPLLRDEDWWLRIAAAQALGSFGREPAVDGLIAALADPDVRLAALEALAMIGSTRCLKSVAQLLRDADPEVRREAVSTLGRFAEPRILPVLKQVYDLDKDETVRSRAAEVSRDLAARLGVRSPIDLPDAQQRAQHPIDRVLIRAREQGAGDLHFAVGQRPWMRSGASFAPMGDVPVFDATTMGEWLLPLLDDAQRRRFDELGEVDFCHVIPGIGRYRANLFQERNGLAAAFRVIPDQPLSCQEIGLPEHLSEILEYHQGLVVISGPAGSGKTTTLGALVNLLNEAKPSHIVTVEDPIELVHASKVALVNQRQTGTHTAGFASALRASLREDPDVIVIGEMRDLETIRMALSAAETGHLVIATIQTTGAVATIDRMIDAFPPDEQPQVRSALSETLKYVVSQSLAPAIDPRKRAAVFEVLKVTLSVSHLIREGKEIQIPSVMQTGRASGMVTIDQALQKLVEEKVIAPEVALERAENKERFDGTAAAVSPVVTLRGAA